METLKEVLDSMEKQDLVINRALLIGNSYIIEFKKDERGER